MSRASEKKKAKKQAQRYEEWLSASSASSSSFAQPEISETAHMGMITMRQAAKTAKMKAASPEALVALVASQSAAAQKALRARMSALVAALEADDERALSRTEDEVARQYLREDVARRPQALTTAIVKRRPHSVAWLIALGASLDAENVIADDTLIRAASDCELGVRIAPLHVAALMGDVKTGRALLAAGADVNVRCSIGCTPLFASFTKPFTEMLIANGARADLTCHSGRNALFAACYFDAEEVVRLLIAAGASVDAIESNGKFALWVCAVANASRCARLLLAAGAQANQVNGIGQSAAAAAIEEGRSEPLEALIGAEAKARDIPLAEVATLALFALARAPRMRRRDGCRFSTLIAFDTTNTFAWSDALDRVACLRSLCSLGAKADARDGEGHSPLDRALLSATPDVELVVALLDCGVTANRAAYEKTALDLALMPPTTPELLDAFLALPDFRPEAIVNTSTGQIALMRVLLSDGSKDRGLIRRLLVRGPCLSCVDRRGFSAWDYARETRELLVLFADWASLSLAATSADSAPSSSLDLDAFACARSSIKGQATTRALMTFLPSPMISIIAAFAGCLEGMSDLSAA